MQQTALSVIIPIMNMEREICGVLNTLKEETKNFNVEFLLIDTGSKDGTIQAALRFLKMYHVNGCVMQEWGGNTSQALNVGIQHANGDYITFIFPHCMYQSYLADFLKKAQETKADLLFGCKRQEQLRFADLRTSSSVIKNPTGVDCIDCMITHSMVPDVGAIMVSKQFIKQNKILFCEHNLYGYGEQFIYRCMLCTNQLVQVRVVMQVDKAVSILKSTDCEPQDIFAPFGEVETLLRTLAMMQRDYGQHDHLIRKLMQHKIPETIINQIESLLRQKIKTRTIRSFMHKKGYDRLLITGSYTPHSLKVKISTWRFFPKFYRF